MKASDSLSMIVSALERSSAASSDFDLNPNTILPKDRKLRPAAVLIPLIFSGDNTRLILTKRSSGLKHHPGQIAFPGGKLDETDASLEYAALREAKEEIGLTPDNVEVLGVLPTHETVTGFTISPIIGLVRDTFLPVIEEGEVAEVFQVPLDHVMNPSSYLIQSRYWRGEQRYYYTVPYGPYYIWGATARILRGLAERMTQ